MNTTYFLNLVSGNVFGSKKNPEIPEEFYIGLSSTTPDMSGEGVTEPSTTAGYKRVLLDSLSQPVDGVVSNEDDINFEESTSNWGTITHFVIYDAEAVGGGNLLMYGALSTPRTVETATVMTIKAGYLKLSTKNPD